MRRIIRKETNYTAATAVALDDFVAPPESKSSKPKRMSREQFAVLLIETNELKTKEDWKSFTPKHFVGLYSLLHQHVYSVVPDEIRDSYYAVIGAATRMFVHEFDRDARRMIDFIKWVWIRESKRQKYRSSDNDFRIGWRLQFGAPLLIDYRVSCARGKKKTNA